MAELMVYTPVRVPSRLPLSHSWQPSVTSLTVQDLAKLDLISSDMSFIPLTSEMYIPWLFTVLYGPKVTG